MDPIFVSKSGLTPHIHPKRAVDLIYATSEAGTVQLLPGSYSPQSNSDVTTAGIELYSDSAIVIIGNSSTLVDCGGNGRAFVISGGGSLVTLQGFTINNCHSINSSNTVADVSERSRGSATSIEYIAMSDSQLQQYDGDGGAILVLDRAAPNISDITISNCYASSHGGGIRVERSETLLSLFRNGGIDDEPTFTNIFFYGNTARMGAAISLYMSAASINACNVTGNNASVNGGGLDCYYYSEPSVTNTSWRANYAAVGGGAVALDSYLTQPNFQQNTFQHNTAANGGGIYILNGALAYFENSLVEFNTATGYGGGIYMSNTGSDQVISLCQDSIGLLIQNNSATHGGGMFFDLTDDTDTKKAIKTTETTMCDDVCGADSNGYFGNTATFGPGKTSDATAIFIVTQPQTLTSPISTSVDGDVPSLNATFALVDIFQAYVTSASGSELELTLYPSLCTDDDVTCVQVSSTCSIDSKGMVILGGANCSMSLTQALESQNFTIMADGSADLDYINWNESSTIEVTSCDTAMYEKCLCSDDHCGCWLTSASQYTCVGINSSEGNISGLLWVIIWVIVGVTSGLCCLTIAGLLAYRKYKYERDWNPNTTMFNNAEDADPTSTLAFRSFGYGVLDYTSHLRIEDQIGTGNFGSVFLAVLCRRDTMPARYVAVKELHLQEEEAAAELVQEALLMKEIPYHCCVVRLLGVCLAPPCLVTELVEGAKEVDKYLQDVLHQQHSRTDDDEAGTTPQYCSDTYAKIALTVMRDAASGLQHLHDHEIIHRDVAARNVLVNSSGRALVSDFGLSLNFAHGAKNNLASLGSDRETQNPLSEVHSAPSKADGGAALCHEMDGDKPYFRAAPENYGVSQEAKGRDIHTKKSDVFMYGTMLWEALSGKWAQLTETGRLKRGYLIYFTEASGLPVDADVDFVTLPAQNGEDAKRGLLVMARKLDEKHMMLQEQIDRLVELTIMCLQKEQAARCDFTHVCTVLDDLIGEGLVDQVHTPAPTMQTMAVMV